MMIFTVWITFIPLEQKKRLESHKKVFENKDLCKLIMPSEDIKILKLNQYQKSGKHYLLFIQIVNG